MNFKEAKLPNGTVYVAMHQAPQLAKKVASVYRSDNGVKHIGLVIFHNAEYETRTIERPGYPRTVKLFADLDRALAFLYAYDSDPDSFKADHLPRITHWAAPVRTPQWQDDAPKKVAKKKDINIEDEISALQEGLRG